MSIEEKTQIMAPRRQSLRLAGAQRKYRGR
jgi:hypothetical protein